MSTQFWHTSFNSVGNVVLFSSEAQVRAALRRLARVASGQLLGFCLVDTHCHFHIADGRRGAGRLMRGIQQSMAAVIGAALQPTHYEPIADQRHNLNTVRYLLKQPSHHDLPGHPALWSGSVLLDLLGARCLGGLASRLDIWMPRLGSRDYLVAVGLPPEPLTVAPAEIRAALGIAPATLRRLRAGWVSSALLAAVQRRLALEELVARGGGPPGLRTESR
jgi:hypothetical protein